MASGISPASILYDEDGNPVMISQEGNTYHVGVRDDLQIELLNKILYQLRQMNFHLAELSGVCSCDQIFNLEPEEDEQ